MKIAKRNAIKYTIWRRFIVQIIKVSVHIQGSFVKQKRGGKMMSNKLLRQILFYSYSANT